MRLRSVYAKTIYDRRHGLLWWSVGIGLLTVAVLSVWPSVRDEYQKLVENYPEGLLALFGIEKSGLGSATGYLQAELFGLMVPLTLIAYMIAAGSAATAGERDRGTLEFLLSQPVSRTRVLVEKSLGLGTALATITIAFAVVLVAFARVFALHVAAPKLLAATVSVFLLALLFGAVALLAGSVTGHRGLAAGIASAAAIAAFLVNSLGALVEGLKRFRPLSPFWWYGGHDPLQRGLEPLHVVLLIAGIIVLTGAAVVVFRRRDLT
jgi:ABC-2 type transport system permease protein